MGFEPRVMVWSNDKHIPSWRGLRGFTDAHLIRHINVELYLLWRVDWIRSASCLAGRVHTYIIPRHVQQERQVVENGSAFTPLFALNNGSADMSRLLHQTALYMFYIRFK